MSNLNICIVLFCFFHIGRGSPKSVHVGFQLDGRVSTDSVLHFKGTIPRLQKFTICYRWQILQFRDDMFILSYTIEEQDNEMTLEHEIDSIVFECCDFAVKIKLDFDSKLDEKDSLCLALDLSERYATAVINKKVMQFINISEESLFVREDGNAVIGQDQDFINGGYNKLQSFRGYINDFSLVNKVLTTSEMLEFTNCSKHFQLEPKDIIFDFSNIDENFEAFNVSITHKNFDPNFCHSSSSFMSLIPGLRTFYEAKEFCHSVGGEVVVPRNAEENENLYNYLNTYKAKCESTYTAISWLGAFYNNIDGHVEHYLTGNELSYINIKTNRTSKPDNKCIAIIGSDMDSPVWYGVWYIKSCSSYKTCVTCFFSRPRKLHLRGLCKDSPFDRYYYLTVENGTEYFRGEKYSSIRLVTSTAEKEKLGYWIMYRKDIPSASAIMKQKYKNHFPIGKNNWDIDEESCQQDNTDLILTFCKTNEFTCSDGSCIPLKKRCNLQLDCDDHSDEADCLPLILPKSYSNQIPAPKPSIDEPLRIRFHFCIYSIKDFDLKGYNFVAEIFLGLEWRDSRLKFKNLKKDEVLNVIDGEGDSLPWLPRYRFEGDQNSSGEVSTLDYRLRIRRRSPPLPDNDEFTVTEEKFLGSENDLVLRHKFTLQTSCQFDLSNFPFDTQSCKIYFIPGFPNNDTSTLEPIDSGVTFSGKRRLLDYMIQKPLLYKINYGSSKVNAIEIRFKSLSSFYITNTYVPTLILIVIGYLPFYFPVEDFSDRIVVAITSLLVEAAFFTQLGESMPQTSYLKMIDIWCIFCIVIIFVISLLLTIINYFRDKNRKSGSPVTSIKRSRRCLPVSSKNLNYFGRIFIPAVVIIFVVVYIVVTL